MLEAHLKSITKCCSTVISCQWGRSKRNILHNTLANHHGRCQGARVSASNTYFISILASQCGLKLHNVTSASTVLHYCTTSSTVWLCMCLSTSVTKSSQISCTRCVLGKWRWFWLWLWWIAHIGQTCLHCYSAFVLYVPSAFSNSTGWC